MRQLMILVAALTAAGPTAAAVYHESGDAGAMPGLAQDVAIASPLEAIEGRIAHAFDADLFRIRIDDPAAFSARAKVVAGLAPDLQLFLFDNWGHGVVANDNWLASALPQIPSGTLRGRPPGTYLLGVSPAGGDPLAPSGTSTERIFPDVPSGLSEPVGLLRFAPLFDWTRDLTAIGGSYSLELTGVSGILQPPVLPGDYNQNGAVDATDYTVWRDNLGSGTTLPNDDTPGVGSDDYDRWKNNFGATAGSGAGVVSLGDTLSEVPEPSTLMSLAVALSLVTRMRSSPKQRKWRHRSGRLQRVESKLRQHATGQRRECY